MCRKKKVWADKTVRAKKKFVPLKFGHSYILTNSYYDHNCLFKAESRFGLVLSRGWVVIIEIKANSVQLKLKLGLSLAINYKNLLVSLPLYVSFKGDTKGDTKISSTFKSELIFLF